MAKEQAPAFQLYAKDFLSDENTAVMSARQIGAYFLLMLYVWQQQRVVDEDAHLARLARVTDDEWRDDSRIIRRCFVQVDDEGVTYLRHNRLDEERRKQADWREKSSKGGKSRRRPRKARTTLQPPLNHPSTTLEPFANTSSASSSASALEEQVHAHAKRKTVEEVFGPDAEDASPAGWFLRSWPVWFSEERNGARTLMREARDWPLACSIVETWPDRAYLEKLARTFLGSKGDKLKWAGERSLSQFATSAPGIDAWLRESA